MREKQGREGGKERGKLKGRAQCELSGCATAQFGTEAVALHLGAQLLVVADLQGQGGGGARARTGQGVAWSLI